MWNARKKAAEYVTKMMAENRPIEIRDYWSSEFREGVAQALIVAYNKATGVLKPPLKPEPLDPFWVVWNPNQGSPRVRHPHGADAIGEASRLSHANPGYSFFVLKVIGVAETSTDTVWRPAKE